MVLGCGAMNIFSARFLFGFCGRIEASRALNAVSERSARARRVVTSLFRVVVSGTLTLHAFPASPTIAAKDRAADTVIHSLSARANASAASSAVAKVPRYFSLPSRLIFA